MRTSRFACLAVLIAAGSNGVGDLRKELAYMQTHNPSFAGAALVEGTEPFNPDLAG